MTRATLFRTLLAAVVVALIASSCLPQTSRRGMKVHLEVDTPRGLVQRAGVIRIVYSRAPFWFPTGTGNRNGAGLEGEAPYVALGDGRYLFMLLEDPPGGRRQMLSLADVLSRSPKGATIPPELVPSLVVFQDPAQVTSIARVDPADLAATLGPGYALRRVWVEPTREKLVFGALEKVLPFRRALEGPAVDRIGREEQLRSLRYPSPTDPRMITWMDFQRGGPE